MLTTLGDALRRLPVDIFAHPDFDAHEQVVFATDEGSGLRAIISVHNTNRGPGLGGCRIWPYDSEADAVTDVLRLARGMTYKAALAGLDLGGGKSVILADAKTQKTPDMMRAMGVAVERLGGRYIVAEDVGATPADMDAIATQTTYVSGRSNGVGDPSPWTAEGVYLCLERAVQHRRNTDLSGVRVAVKGLGAVGGKLARKLAQAGATLFIADIRDDAARTIAAETGATVVGVDEATSLNVDVYAPCALGGELDARTIDTIKAEIICGAANNQLATPEDGARLAARGILYCPDYLVNAGGLISVAREAIPLSDADAEAKLRALPDTLQTVGKRSDADQASMADTADLLAEERFKSKP
ncbi:MAG: Glu/Leu/Phe/Val dehydrogenase dimerization domain-containing protein [Pseudomonadota bacterium]